VDKHGIDYLPSWYTADRAGWEATARRLKATAMISLQRDGSGCGAGTAAAEHRPAGGGDLSGGPPGRCWGEWYHTFGVLAFGIHEAAVLGETVGDLASYVAAALNAVYAKITGGSGEDPVKARIDLDAAAVGAAYVARGRRHGRGAAAYAPVEFAAGGRCETRAGYVNGA